MHRLSKLLSRRANVLSYRVSIALLSLASSSINCKSRDVDIWNTQFRCRAGMCEVEFDLYSRLPVTALVDVKLEAFTRKNIGKGAVVQEVCAEKVIQLEIAPDKSTHLIEKLKTSKRIDHVRVKVLRSSSR